MPHDPCLRIEKLLVAVDGIRPGRRNWRGALLKIVFVSTGINYSSFDKNLGC